MADMNDPARARGGRRRFDTRDPRRSRERALKILFQADVRGESPAETLRRVENDPNAWSLLDDLDPEAASEVDAVSAQAVADARAGTTLRAAASAPGLDGFTRTLVRGVASNRDELDELIGRYARRWAVSRMPVIDRNILRLGAFELQHEATSPAIVLNEVIELAKALSTEDSGRYVNGVLESIRKHVAAEREVNAEVDVADGIAEDAADAVADAADEVVDPLEQRTAGGDGG